MSGVKDVPTTHDVTERLAWETQAPLTVRPNEFKAFPAKTDWKIEREKMRKVCLACHSDEWADGHFTKMDQAIENYNENYYKPMLELTKPLYDKNLIDNTKRLDEPIEFEMYELWHHEGRRARFGAAMMAPDYAWWHGFYELKKRFITIEEMTAQLLESDNAQTHKVKGAGGDTNNPLK